jgi:hypothetical protein
MKILWLALIALSATLGAVVVADGDDSEPAYYCHSQISDGGYAVKIWPDRATGTAKISVGRDSRGGVHDWTTYAVRITQAGQDTLFQGNGPMLTMSEGLPGPGGHLAVAIISFLHDES